MLKTDAEVDSGSMDAGKIVIIRFCDEQRDRERILEQRKFTYFSYSGELFWMGAAEIKRLISN